jgi:F0F1-type ATP synthase assembly protein I
MAITTQSNRNEIQIAVMASELKQMKEDISEIKADIKKFIDSMDVNFVTRNEFEPYKRTVQMISGAVILAIIGALLNLVLVH